MKVDAARCAAVGPSGPGGFERRSTHSVHNSLSIAQRCELAEELDFCFEPHTLGFTQYAPGHGEILQKGGRDEPMEAAGGKPDSVQGHCNPAPDAIPRSSDALPQPTD